MSVMAIIPARGQSKGIPRKNLLRLCGKPLVVYSIEQALACPLVNEVVVSTEDAEIGEVAKAAGAAVCWRPEELASDDSPTEDAIRHVLATHGSSPDVVVLLQPTSPIRQPETIETCLVPVLHCGCTSSYTVREIEGFQHSLWIEPYSVLLSAAPRQMRQKKMRYCEENGSVYCFRTDGFSDAADRIYGRKVTQVLMHPLDSFQLDEPWQIKLFETLMPLRLKPRVTVREKKIDRSAPGTYGLPLEQHIDYV